MDTRRLTEIEERCEKATPGPWTVVRCVAGDRSAAFVTDIGEHGRICRIWDERTLAGTNGIFIAHARTDLPDLLAYCKSLRAEAAELARNLYHARYCPYGIARTQEWTGPWVESPCNCGVAEILSRPTVVELLKEKD